MPSTHYRQKLNVWPIHGQVRQAFVQSQRPNIAPYLVDLDTFDGNGECPCDEFQMRDRKRVMAQMKLLREQRTFFWCEHLKAFRFWLFEKTLAHDREITGAVREKV